MKAKYYDIKDDFKKYPDAWLYCIWSKRGPGKTYSTLRYMIENKKKFVFMKRTIKDVEMLCKHIVADGMLTADTSPFVPLNRDFGYNIYPHMITSDGMAGFYNSTFDDKGNLQPVGDLLGWCVACSAITKYKGFDMSEADFLIFDEFIPKTYERINHYEGDAVLDLYMTIKRDRDKRGRPPLKLILLANATSLSCPMFDILELTDYVAEMSITGTEYKYIESGLMLHSIRADFDREEDQELEGIEKHMAGTAWGQVTFGGTFAYNDTSNIKNLSLKGFRPITSFIYKRTQYYIYKRETTFYICKNKHQSDEIYNLNRENDQKRFFYDYVIDLRESCISDNVIFDSYVPYDLIINYRKYFTL